VKNSSQARIRGWLFVAGQFALIIAITLSPSEQSSAVLFALGRLVFLVGAVILGISALNLGKSLTAHPQPLESATLKTTGLYAWVRHPIYSGLILLMLGSVLMAPSVVKLLLLTALVVLLNFKAKFEETFLISKYENYGKYSMKVGKFFPRFIRK
jgi:protein-S-isoprenylcysteine O-methyltransferase Ste14